MAIDTVARALAINAKEAAGSASSLSIKTVASVDEVKDSNVLYLVPKEGTSGDIYNEYICVNGSAEKIGSTDLTDYALKSDIATVGFSGSYNDLTEKLIDYTDITDGNEIINFESGIYKNNSTITFPNAISGVSGVTGGTTDVTIDPGYFTWDKSTQMFFAFSQGLESYCLGYDSHENVWVYTHGLAPMDYVEALAAIIPTDDHINKLIKTYVDGLDGDEVSY